MIVDFMSEELFKFSVHAKTLNEAESDLLILTTDEAAQERFQSGDIIEIYHPKEKSSHLLIQIQEKSIKKAKSKDTSVSIEQRLAGLFHLKSFSDVCIKQVPKELVTLDIVELIIRDQFLSRSDMWQLKNQLQGTCAFVTEKREHALIALQFGDMWMNSGKVMCGYISSETRVLFRSCTATINIFIQMSSEMWEYDYNGDRYFEKAVDGFLSELFEKWKKEKCWHDVTVTLFSRTYYKARSIQEFPATMRHCLQRAKSGEFYEDFYRVIAQNERFEDWSPTLLQIKKQFRIYANDVFKCHGPDMPTGANSCAKDGNILEVLNLSLNLYEAHYIDRNFDRTGKVSIVITPGCGVFRVDRELVGITRSRVIDAGISSDLVCMGEQPLHASPLFVFIKDQMDTENEYYIPYWINQSYYSKKNGSDWNEFQPRMRIPESVLDSLQTNCFFEDPANMGLDIDDDDFFDKWDDMLFDVNKPSGSSSTKPNGKSQCWKNVLTLANDTEVKANTRKWLLDAHDDCALLSTRLEDSPTRRFQPLINPFDPLHLYFKVTPYRRRWVHAFPRDESSRSTQLHHQFSRKHDSQLSDSKFSVPLRRVHIDSSSFSALGRSPTTSDQSDGLFEERRASSPISVSGADFMVTNRQRQPSFISQAAAEEQQYAARFETLFWSLQPSETVSVWGMAGEPWSPNMTTGVDWKSLIMPASLPLTTDYFPDAHSIVYDYYINTYSLEPDIICCMDGDVDENFIHELYEELIVQRIDHGFQCVIRPDAEWEKIESILSKNDITYLGEKACRLSIGGTFQKIFLRRQNEKLQICTTRFRPRHSYTSAMKKQYQYRFQCPDSNSFEVWHTIFHTDHLDNYNWNYLDHYLCTRGQDSAYELTSVQLKYWRSRFFLLPRANPATRKIIDGADRCDIYERRTLSELDRLRDAFIIVMESMNAAKRSSHSVKTAGGPPSPALTADSPTQQIVDCMLGKSSKTPLNFISHSSLQKTCFIGSDAVRWVTSNIGGLTSDLSAVELLQNLVNEQYIRHASGHTFFPFINGFYLYYLTGNASEKAEMVSMDLFQFHRSEVAILDYTQENYDLRSYSAFELITLQNQLYRDMINDSGLPSGSQYIRDMADNWRYSLQYDYKCALLPIDRKKTMNSRFEWVTCKYLSYYHPEYAFELECQWMVVTVALLSNLLQHWSRRSDLFHLLPVPVDPFTLPYNETADPLRGPIFVKLNLEPLSEANVSQEELWLFQEEVLYRFGFMKMWPSQQSERTDRQFVHCTGGMFVLFFKRSLNQASSLSAHPRHLSIDKSQFYPDVGFLWSWNHMLSQRWRTLHTGDIDFQDKMLADFRRFCQDEDGRLSELWSSFGNES